MQNTKCYYVIALNIIPGLEKYGSQYDEYHVRMADTFLSNPREKNPQQVSMKTFSTSIEVEKVCSLSGFIETKSAHELALLILMAKFQ